MNILTFMKTNRKLYMSNCYYDRVADKETQKEIFEEALRSMVCELCMEWICYAVISEDYKTATFVLDAVIGDLSTVHLTFMEGTPCVFEVSLELSKALRPERSENIGRYVMVPITVTLRDRKESKVYTSFTYHAHIPVDPTIKNALEWCGLSSILRRAPRPFRAVANACEAIGMDAD